MPSKKTVTIQDVAREAGVSPATVSRVLSNDDYAVEETIQKVFRAVEKTGYRILKAKTKPSDDHKNILVVCSSMRDQGSSYFLEGIERSAGESGYSTFIRHLMMSQVAAGKPNAEELLSWVKGCDAAGLLIFSDAVDSEAITEVGEVVPTATMMTDFSDPGISSVDVDEEDMIRKCLQHLIRTGKKKIALITGQSKYRRCKVVKDIYFSLLKEMGLESNQDWCANIDTNYFSTSAAVAADQMLKNPNPPDAFITTSDIYAAGVIYACSRIGLHIPEDVAVVGRDNSSVCHVTIPQITSFNMPAEMIGYTACNSLIAKIEGPERNTRNIVLTCDLIVRDSTARNITTA